jgi:hypothetical protein
MVKLGKGKVENKVALFAGNFKHKTILVRLSRRFLMQFYQVTAAGNKCRAHPGYCASSAPTSEAVFGLATVVPK